MGNQLVSLQSKQPVRRNVWQKFMLWKEERRSVREIVKATEKSIKNLSSVDARKEVGRSIEQLTQLACDGNRHAAKDLIGILNALEHARTPDFNWTNGPITSIGHSIKRIVCESEDESLWRRTLSELGAYARSTNGRSIYMLLDLVQADNERSLVALYELPLPVRYTGTTHQGRTMFEGDFVITSWASTLAGVGRSTSNEKIKQGIIRRLELARLQSKDDNSESELMRLQQSIEASLEN
jgi:hypothetical protein